MRFAFGHRELTRRGKADGERDVLGAGPAPAVLGAAEEQRLERRAAAQVHRADTLGRADLVPADGGEVERHGLGVDVHLAEGLNRVGVEEDAVRLGESVGLVGEALHGDHRAGLHRSEEHTSELQSH